MTDPITGVELMRQIRAIVGNSTEETLSFFDLINLTDTLRALSKRELVPETPPPPQLRTLADYAELSSEDIGRSVVLNRTSYTTTELIGMRQKTGSPRVFLIEEPRGVERWVHGSHLAFVFDHKSWCNAGGKGWGDA